MLYHVLILSEVDTTPVTYHVLVNALDGSVRDRKKKNENASYLNIVFPMTKKEY